MFSSSLFRPGWNFIVYMSFPTCLAGLKFPVRFELPGLEFSAWVETFFVQSKTSFLQLHKFYAALHMRTRKKQKNKLATTCLVYPHTRANSQRGAWCRLWYKIGNICPTFKETLSASWLWVHILIIMKMYDKIEWNNFFTMFSTTG